MPSPIRNPFAAPPTLPNASSPGTQPIATSPTEVMPQGGVQLFQQGPQPIANFDRWDTSKAVNEGFRASEWVYVSVNRIARAVSGIPWKVFQKTVDGRIPYPKIHPIEQLMTSPNLYTSDSDWLELIMQHLLLGGNAVNRAILHGGVPVALVPLMPDNVDVVASPSKFIERYDVYTFRGNGKLADQVPLEEILHIKFTDPSNLYWGISPLQAVARTVDTDVEAVKFNKISLQNRAVADGAFIVNQAITPEQYTQLRQMVRDQHQGSNNAHAPWVLGFGMDWKPMSISPLELDFINSRKMNRVSILAVYNVPPPVAGIYDDATYNNVRTAYYAFWTDTVIPHLDDLRGALTFYFQQFKGFGTDWILDYDLSQVEALKPVFKDRVDAAHVLWTMGVPLNTLNQRFELDLPQDILYADVAFVAGVKTAKDIVSGVIPVAAPPVVPIVPVAEGPKIVTFSAIPDVRTPLGRREWWIKQDNMARFYEGTISKLALAHLIEDYNTVSQTFAQDGIITSIDGVQWRKSLMGIGTAILLDAGNRMLRILKQSSSVSSQFDATGFDLSEKVTNFLHEWVNSTTTYITASTIDMAQRIVDTGHNEGLSVMAIAGNIRDAATVAELRSLRIAASVSVRLQNNAILEAGKQSELVEYKVWVSMHDDKVRDTHAEADGQEVPIDDTFSVGSDDMDYPGDESADISETANCRCTLAFIMVDENNLSLGNKGVRAAISA